MIDVKAIALPFFEFLAPHKAGQPLYLVPERAAVLCLADVIIARDTVTGEEKPVWGTGEFERLKAGEDLQCEPVLVVELNFANELEDLIDLVTAVRCENEGDEDENLPADDPEDDEDDEDELDDEFDLDEDDEEDLEDEEDEEDEDEWEEVGDEDDEKEDEADGDDEEPDADDPVAPNLALASYLGPGSKCH